MSKHEKLLHQILTGRGDKSIHFDALCGLLCFLGFQERIRGDHHIFVKDGIEEILNLQPLGNNAKPYQVKQVRGLFLRYRIRIEE